MIPYNALNFSTSKTTVELRDLVNNGVDIWAFDYPSYYKGDAKKEFEQKVIDHYYFREIGQETTGRWLHYFRTKVREIMPYYIELYESVDLLKGAGDPFEAYNLTETYTRTHSSQGSTSGSSETDSEGTSERSMNGTHTKNSDSEGVRKHSDTPQGSINNLETYMTDGTIDTLDASENVTDTESATDTNTARANASSESTSADSGEESYTLTRRGNIGVQPLGQELKVYREALINVDMMVINELNDLFLKVY